MFFFFRNGSTVIGSPQVYRVRFPTQDTGLQTESLMDTALGRPTTESGFKHHRFSANHLLKLYNQSSRNKSELDHWRFLQHFVTLTEVGDKAYWNPCSFPALGWKLSSLVSGSAQQEVHTFLGQANHCGLVQLFCNGSCWEELASPRAGGGLRSLIIIWTLRNFTSRS